MSRAGKRPSGQRSSHVPPASALPRELLVGAIALLGLAFAALWALVGLGLTRPLDLAGLVLIHEGIHSGEGLDFFLGITQLGYSRVYAPIAVGVVVVMVALRWFADAVRLMLSLAGADATNLLVKVVVGRHRPHEPWTLTHPGGYSFPSGHATVAAALFAFAFVLVARHVPGVWRIPLLVTGSLLALAIASSRLVLAVHWPSDVLAGMVCGTAWALIALQTPVQRGTNV